MWGRGDSNEMSHDPLSMYLEELASVQPLTNDEEIALFGQMRQHEKGDERWDIAARRLIENRLHMVVSIAERYSSSGIPMLELVEEGNIGLMRAIISFAEAPQGEFTVYASTCIEDAITKAIAKSKQK